MGQDRIVSPNDPDVLRIRNADGTEDVHYSATYQAIPEECRLYAQRVLNETEENKAKGLHMLKEYIKREGLTCPGDNFLLAVLRNRKYNLDGCETKLKQFLDARRMIGGKMAQFDMAQIEFILDEITLCALPYRDKHGRLILYTRPNLKFDKHEKDEIVFCALVILLFLLSFPMTSIYGVCSIGECKTSSMSLFYPITKIYRKIIPILMDMPYRICKIDITNTHFIGRWTISILRPLLPEKIAKRICVHSPGYEGVHKLFNPDILPDVMDGNLGPLSIKHYRESLLNFIQKLRDESR